MSSDFFDKIVKTIKKDAELISPGTLILKLIINFGLDTLIKSTFLPLVTFIGILRFLTLIQYDL